MYELYQQKLQTLLHCVYHLLMIVISLEKTP